MSSILTALKKLEHEKTIKKPDAFRIDAEILQGGSPRRFISTGIIFTAATALFLCGVGTMFLYLKYVKTDAHIQPAHVLNHEKKNASESTVPPVKLQPNLSANTIPVVEKPVMSPRLMIKRQQPQSVMRDNQQVVPVKPKPESQPKPVTPAITPVKPPVVLRVNGIAFQDGTESVAVINGKTVSKGSVIEGARVEEIQKDNVRLSRDGEMLYLMLEKSD